MSHSLPIRWSAPLSGLCIDPPLLLAGVVTCRVGGAVVAFDARDGTPRWSVDLDGGATRPFFVAGGRVVVGTQQAPERLTRLTGIDATGTVVWQTFLGTVAGDGGCTQGDRAYLPAMRVPRGVSFHALDVSTGAVTSTALEWGMQGLAVAGEQLVARSRFGSAKSPGLYFISPTGIPGQRLLDAPVYTVLTDLHRIYCVTAGTGPSRYELLVRGADGLTSRWATPIGTFQCALDGTQLVHADPSDPRVVVSRDAETGDVRWQSEPVSREVGLLVFAGALVFARSDDGLFLLQRKDGRLVGLASGGYAVTSRDGVIYVSGDNGLQCWAPAG